MNIEQQRKPVEHFNDRVQKIPLKSNKIKCYRKQKINIKKISILVQKPISNSSYTKKGEKI